MVADSDKWSKGAKAISAWQSPRQGTWAVLSTSLPMKSATTGPSRAVEPVQKLVPARVYLHLPCSQINAREAPTRRHPCVECDAMDEFRLPAEPEELWAGDCELAFRCENFVDLSESSPEEIGGIAESEQLPPVQPQPSDSSRGSSSPSAP